MRAKKTNIYASERQQHVLKRLLRRGNTPHWLAKRARLILEAVHGASNTEISERLPLDRTRVVLWIKRWTEQYPELCRIEQEQPSALETAITDVLRDQSRPGAPSTFTDEQIKSIVAVALEEPSVSDRNIRIWTMRELRDEVIKREVVTDISLTQLSRFLKKFGISVTDPKRINLKIEE